MSDPKLSSSDTPSELARDAADERAVMEQLIGPDESDNELATPSRKRRRISIEHDPSGGDR